MKWFNCSISVPPDSLPSAAYRVDAIRPLKVRYKEADVVLNELL